MKHIRSKNSGFTIVEVVIASVVFSIAVAGIMSTITAMNRPAEESKEDVAAALVGKQILEDLRQQVDADTWDDNVNGLLNPVGGPAANGTYPCPHTPLVIDGITYTCNYTVTQDPESDARRVDITLTW